MEKRHYFTVINIPTSINSIKRVVDINSQITSYLINGTTTLPIPTTEIYNLLVILPSRINEQPFQGIIGKTSTNGKQIWTKDGLYLQIDRTTGTSTTIYIKDFLENIPLSFQGKMKRDIGALKNSIPSVTPTSLITLARHLVESTTIPKEFYVTAFSPNKIAIQDKIIALINNNYYVNSPNEYHPYRQDNIYGVEWVIPRNIYEPTATAGVISEGIRTDMVLNSNKLIYVLTYKGMLSNADSFLNSPHLLYLNQFSHNAQIYQIYLNLKYIYDNTGVIPSLETKQTNYQTLLIPNAFSNVQLKGKVVRVW